MLHCLVILAFCILLVLLAKPGLWLNPLLEFLRKALNKNFNRD